MGIKVLEIILALTVNFVHGANSEHILFCNGSLFEPCPGENQVCNVTTLECSCIEGFVRSGDECESSDDVAHIDHSATTAVVTVFAIVLIASALVLVIRKYNLIDYVRQKIDMRRNRDVMYEDVMIGNDDPPLSP